MKIVEFKELIENVNKTKDSNNKRLLLENLEFAENQQNLKFENTSNGGINYITTTFINNDKVYTYSFNSLCLKVTVDSNSKRDYLSFIISNNSIEFVSNSLTKPKVQPKPKEQTAKKEIITPSVIKNEPITKKSKKENKKPIAKETKQQVLDDEKIIEQISEETGKTKKASIAEEKAKLTPLSLFKKIAFYVTSIIVACGLTVCVGLYLPKLIGNNNDDNDNKIAGTTSIVTNGTILKTYSMSETGPNHDGIDVTSSDRKVYSYAKGSVVSIDPVKDENGKVLYCTVKIRHTAMLYTIYSSILPESSLNVGQKIDCGEYLGIMTQADCEEETYYVHFQVMLDNKIVDPKAFYVE